MNKETAIQILNSGGIGIIPTDTLYGILGRADKPETTEKIYRLKERTPSKPFIILISQIEDLEKFDIKVSEKDEEIINKYWPGKVSIIFRVDNPKFNYLTRETESLAFRLPAKVNLQEILKHTGPLVAPSANPEGEKPAENIEEANLYFGNRVDFYIDEGDLKGEPSTLISIKDGVINVLREGVVKI